jgi:hypothetical protein
VAPNRVVLPDNEPAIPCGLVAKSYFNDTFKLVRKGAAGDRDVPIVINENNIAWTSDIESKFKNI